MIPFPLDFALKSAMLAAAALGTMPFLKSRSAAFRHGVLTAAAVVALLLPLLEVFVPAWSFTIPNIPSSVSQAPRVHGVLPIPGHDAARSDAVSGHGAAAATVSRVLAEPALQLPVRILGVTWLAGAVLYLTALVVGFGRVVRLIRRAIPVVEPSWMQSLTGAARDIGLQRPIRLFRSDHPTLIGVCGCWKPVLVVPPSSRDWCEERIRFVLQHELAHVRRFDWPAQIIAEVLQAVCWFNPLLSMLRSRLRLESERACDDAVLRGGGDSTAYAEDLADLARTFNSLRTRGPGMLAVSMARPAGLERRINAMFQPDLDRRPLSRTNQVTIAAAALTIACVLAGAAAAAQVLSSFAGTLVDETDGVLPEVRMILTNSATRASYEVRSDSAGRFEFPVVPAGQYVLETDLPGFAMFQGLVTIGAADARETRLTLQLGTIEETIRVVSDRAKPDAVAIGHPPGSPVGQTRTSDTGGSQAAGQRMQRKIVGRIIPTRASDTRSADGLRVGGNIRAPRKLVDVRPIYPEALSVAQVGGAVELQGAIGPDGTVQGLTVLWSSHQEFANAAQEAVRQWQFDPTLLNGDPVAVGLRVHVSFDAAPGQAGR